MKTVLLIGGPGAGKGTQSERLSQWLGVAHISTGALFREHIAAGTPLGRQAETYISRGQLVPDSLADQLARERLSRPDARNGYVLDGYPRSLPQAKELDVILRDNGQQLDAAVYLSVPDGDIVERLCGRLTCGTCGRTYHQKFYPPKSPGICDVCGGQLYQRDDDNPETVRSRLKTFHGVTCPILDYYRGKGLLIEIDATIGKDKVSERIREAVGKEMDRLGFRPFPLPPPSPRDKAPSSSGAGP